MDTYRIYGSNNGWYIPRVYTNSTNATASNEILLWTGYSYGEAVTLINEYQNEYDNIVVVKDGNTICY